MSLSLVSATLGLPSPLEAANHQRAWEAWKVEFGKKYEVEEERSRFRAFLQNLALIEERNLAEGKSVHGLTKFSDLTPEEFSSRYLLSHSSPKTSMQHVALPELAAGETSKKDWTGKLTTPVKDQAQCGSCWAFSATEQIESDAMRELGETHILSPQQIVSCDHLGDMGCNGGNTETAYTYVKKSNGMVSDKDYPYTSGHGQTGTCQSSKLTDPVVGVTSYSTIRASSNGASGVESAMAKYVGETGPLSICVDASTWSSYRGGVLSNCGKRIDHCVQAVGIDTGAGYWKVRNSWNTDWGEDGFIRLAYGANTCGLTNDATWVSTTKALAVEPSPALLGADEATWAPRPLMGADPKTWSPHRVVEDAARPAAREVEVLKEAIHQMESARP